MYASKITKIYERDYRYYNKRREKQIAYNKKYNITPKYKKRVRYKFKK